MGESPWNGVLLSRPGVVPGRERLRLVLPPEALNVVRLDVALSDTAWGVYAGWGEVF